MDATVETALRFTPRQPDGWLTRLFDYKPFLVVLCLLPAVGLLVVFLTYPLGLGIWLAFTDTHDRPARPLHRAGQFRLARPAIRCSGCR